MGDHREPPEVAVVGEEVEFRFVELICVWRKQKERVRIKAADFAVVGIDLQGSRVSTCSAGEGR